jgi:hypothetical protein
MLPGSPYYEECPMRSIEKRLILLGLACLFVLACGQSSSGEREIGARASLQASLPTGGNELIDPAGMNVKSRFRTPEGFARTAEAGNSFGAYLRNLHLKPHGSEVRLYDGRFKSNRDAYDAVVDLDIGHRDLHQCADAVMRLRAEYLYGQGQYERIHFNFANGFRVDYSEWMQGKRIVVNGNSTRWEQMASPSNSYRDLWNYLEIVFAYAGSLSLSKELRPVPVADMQIGDVFIMGGSPGHAIIVVDMAVDESGKKIFLLAQSYMPAQEIHVLRNPDERSISPWYFVPDDELLTPEWTFSSRDLRRFSD